MVDRFVVAFFAGSCVGTQVSQSWPRRHRCYNTFDSKLQDTGSYTEQWEPDNTSSLPAWVYQSPALVGGESILAGQWRYPAGGFIQDLPKHLNTSRDIVDDLADNNWLDERTYALLVELNVYQPSTELFSVVIIVFEATETGVFAPWVTISSSRLYLYHSQGVDVSSLVIEILFLVVLITVTVRECLHCRRTKPREYLTCVKSLVEWLLIIFSFTTLGIFIKRMLVARKVLNQYRSARNSFVSFYPAILWDYYLTYAISALVALATMKVMGYLKTMGLFSIERYCFDSLRPNDPYMSLVQIMACRLVGSKSLSEPMLQNC